MKFVREKLLKHYIKKSTELGEKDAKEVKNKDIILEKYQSKVIKYSKFFDRKYYKSEYNLSDVGSLELHYLKEGYKKGYNPSENFNTLGYYSLYKDVEQVGVNPLLHYELFGKEEHRKTGLKAIYEGDYYSLKKRRFILRYLGRILNFFKIKKNKNSKILVVLHMFYMKSTEEIIEYLKNLSCYNYDLIVTYMDGYYDMEYLNKFKEFKKDTKLIKCQNKGYDIGPFIEVINSINLKKYDIVLKLQSKSTNKSIYIYNQFFKDRDWFINLYQGILGSFNVHKMVNRLINDKTCGLVASKNLIVKDPKHKQQLVKEGLKINKLKNIKFYDDYNFVAGSCFAIRSNCLKEMQNLKLTINDFEDTNRGFFSLAHVMERVVCFNISNYNMIGLKAYYFRHLKWRKLEKKLNNLSAMKLVNNKEFTLNDDFIWHYLELRFIEKYEIVDLKLSDLNRQWYDNKNYKINELSPYLYLQGDKKRYLDYINYHKEHNLPVMSVERYDKLIKSIKKKGYDNKHLITVDGNNVILDGQHRSCVLYHILGKDTKIKVLRIYPINIDLDKSKPFSDKIYYIEQL